MWVQECRNGMEPGTVWKGLSHRFFSQPSSCTTPCLVHLQTPTVCLLHLLVSTACLLHLQTPTVSSRHLQFPPAPPDTYSFLLHLQTPTVSSCTSRHLQFPPAPPDTYSFLLHLQTPTVSSCTSRHPLFASCTSLPPAPPSTACLLHLQILLASDTPGVRISGHWIYPNFEQVASDKSTIQ